MFQENICLKISAVGLFCCNKLEKTTNKKVSGRQSYMNLTLVYLGDLKPEMPSTLIYICSLCKSICMRDFYQYLNSNLFCAKV